MPSLEIHEILKEGEQRWGVSLIDDQGVAILRNTTGLTKGTARTTAKALKQKGPDAPFFDTNSEETLDVPAWIAEKTGEDWRLRFTLVSETLFDLLLKPEDGTGDAKIVEVSLVSVKNNLAKAEIMWNPPNADPAYKEKESDETTTEGLAGS